MKYQVVVEMTPNPNASKFIANVDVIRNGKITYKSIEECEHNFMAKAIFMLGSVVEVYFFENVVTVTKTADYPWAVMEEAIIATMLQHLDRHDPDCILDNASQDIKQKYSADLQKIDSILEKTIRSGLRMDGGDLTLLKLEGTSLYIHYEGACGSCPSAQGATLQAIQEILRKEYDEAIDVIAV